MGNKQNGMSRRSFLGGTIKATTAVTLLPSHVIAGLGHKAPSDKLNIAGIGVGGSGFNSLMNMETENIVALCDVDWEFAERNSFRKWPNAHKYMDYRVMFDQQKDIDAVLIATPDHSHALPALTAMKSGYAVYLHAPLTHSVFEARVLAETAKRYEIATQMGNKSGSTEGHRQICEWIWAGAIGDINEVDVWTKHPIWPQNLTRPEKERRIPKTLNWELFIGPAKIRAYNNTYTPWNWRSWWDFGNGTPGHIGCDLLDPVFKALKLEYPKAVEASSTPYNTDSPPNAETIAFWFPRRDNLPKVAMPELKLNWYDGGMMPQRPNELKEGESMGSEEGGVIFKGTKGKIICGNKGENPYLLPTSEMSHFLEPEKIIRRIPNADSFGHEQDWIRAAKEDKNNRVQASSEFTHAALVSETILIGNMAVRLQSLNRKLNWDSVAMKFSNISKTDYIKTISSSAFDLLNGDPQYETKFEELPAQPTVEEWIRHNYREGWDQI